MSNNFDVIIIGGGIIGNSISAHLANENLKIAVVNSNNLGTPASNAAAGLLTPFQLSEYENPSLKDFSFKSFEYFLTFYETIKSNLNISDIDLGFNQVGTLYLIFSITETTHIENELKQLKNLTPKITFLNKQEVLKYEPQITKEILGAYHYPSEGYINNPKFLKAISVYCIEKKVTFLNSEVIEINFAKDKIENIVLANNETITAKKYVLCNGAWANKLLKKILNVETNLIKAIKGEIIQVSIVDNKPLRKIIFCKDGYLLPRPATNSLEKPSILIGSTTCEVNLEENNNTFHNTISGIATLTSLFQKLIPNYKEYHILNMWSGLRPQTKDSMPILGKLPEIDNLYCALGHYRNGILMGPLTGKILKDIMLENSSKYNIEPFKIDRLLKGQSALTNQLSAKSAKH